MGMFCAAAADAKLTAAPLQKPERERKPVGRLTDMVIVLPVAASVTYHKLAWRG